MQPIIQSNRLIFREFTANDAPLMYELNSDPEVVKYVHEKPTTSLELALSAITNNILPQYATYGYGRWAVFLKASDTFIGWCGLKYRPERKEIDLGYRFMRQYWGRGYATESAKAVLEYGFRTLHLPKITAMAHIENLASLRVIEKCGLQFQCFEEVDTCPVKTYSLFNPYQ